MEQSVALGNFVARIKQTYSRRQLNREKQWPPCKSKKLVRLELVKGERRQGYSAGQTRGRDDKAVKRTPLDYSDILKAKDSTGMLKVLVEGDAGIGKTTLCTAISEDWANGELFQEFDILLLLHLRQKEIASAGSVLGLLKLLHSSPEICELVAKHIEYQNEGNVLIVADGWDELSEKNRSEGSFLYELFFGESYSLSVIVTSRPSVSCPLRKLPCIDQLVEVLGFSKDNINKFIQCEFASDEAKGSGLLEQLEGNPLIESVCSVPLNCAIICHLWDYLEGALPSTMSWLYTKIILNIAFRNIKKRPGYDSISSLSHFDDLPESLRQPWSLLCELAFQTLTEDKIVFSHEDLNRKFQTLTLDSELLCFGLLQSAESILEVGHGVSFHFLHLTFQEYLAALYLVRQPPDEQLQLCQSYAGSERFEMVWRFFFGISCAIYKKAINPNVFAVLLDAYIELNNCDLGDKQITALAEALAGEHRKLKVSYIDLSGNKLSDQSVAHLFNRASPAFSQSLGKVHLQGNMIAAKAIHSVTTVLGKSLDGYERGYNDHIIAPGLHLGDNPLGVSGLKALRHALRANKLVNLQVLSLTRSLTDNPDHNAKMIFALGSGHCPNLVELNLSRNNLGEPGGKALGKVLPYLGREVLHLDLDETKLGDKGISAFAEDLHVQYTRKLRRLRLQNNDIHAAGVSSLAESVCAGKIDIDLTNNPLGLGGVTAIVKMLTYNSSDHFLDDGLSIVISGCQLTTTGGSVTNPGCVNAVDVQQLICSQRLQATRTISVLDIDNNNFSGEGIHVLAAFMYACPSLKYLCCRSCGITSNDLKQLLFLVSELKLKFLHLYAWFLNNNDIDDDGVSALIQHLSMLRTSTVQLDGNIRVSHGMLETLKKKLNVQQVRGPYVVDSSNNSELTESGNEDSPHMYSDTSFSGSDSSVDSSSDSEWTENEDYRENTPSHMEDNDTEEQCGTERMEQLQPTPMDLGETTTTDVIIEQHKETTTFTANATVCTSATTIQQSEEASCAQISTRQPVLPIELTSTSLLQGYESMTDTPSTMNQPGTLLGLGQSLDEQPSNVTTKKRNSSTPATQPRKRVKWSEVPLPSSLDLGLFCRVQKSHLFCSGCSKIPVTPYRTNCDCKTLYCEACASEVTGCTTHTNQEITLNKDKSLKTKISKLKLRECPYHQEGCKWEGGEVYRLRQHLSECAYYRKKKDVIFKQREESTTTTTTTVKEWVLPPLIHEELTSTTANTTTSATTIQPSNVTTRKRGSSPTDPQPRKEVGIYSDFEQQSFQESSDLKSATSQWKLQNVHKVLDGEGVVIAILDTGIDTSHEAFKEKFENQQIQHFTDDEGAFLKPEAHGTMAAFVAAGKGFMAKCKKVDHPDPKIIETIKCDPNISIASGVAPNAKLIVCRVGTPYNMEYIIKALEKLVGLKEVWNEEQKKPKAEQNPQVWGVDVVSMSFGVINEILTSNRADKDKMQDLIDKLFYLKVIVVAAAGNYGNNKQTLFPANHPNVFSVGALNVRNRPAATNPSHGVDVYAPGTNIAAPIVGTRDGVAIDSGSSCATPAIAGLVALKIQFERNKHEFLKGRNDNDHHAQQILGGVNIHFQDMKMMFKEMERYSKIEHILDPCDYFRKECRLNIEYM